MAHTQQPARLCSGRKATSVFGQIKDDLFDYENTSATGKPKGNDIQEKKLTLPLIVSLSRAETEERRKILKLINKKSSKRLTYSKIYDFVHNSGGLQYAREKMIENKTQALSILDEFPNNEALESLKLLVNFITERKN